MPRINRRQYVKSTAALAAFGTASLSGCMGGGGESESIDLFLSSTEGGGLDTSSREIQPYYEEIVGMDMAFHYHGGEAVVAHNELLAADANGRNIVVTNASGYAITILDHDLATDDFEMIGNLISDHNVFRMHNDEDRFETPGEMIDYARDNPGEVSVSVPSVEGRNAVTTLMVQEELGVDFNIVVYDGGSEARTALAQQEVDLVNASVYNSLPWADDTQVLTVFADENNWVDLTDDAPTFNDALDVDLPTDGIAARYLWLTTAEDYNDSPDQVEELQNALDEAAHSDEYRSDLAERDPPEDGKIFYLDPEETEAANQESIEIYDGARDLIEAEFE